MQRKAIIYSRVSTDEQKENGFSLREQETRLRKYCASNEYQIVAHYQDDHSAKTFERPQFQKMLSDIGEKKVKADLFICVRWDRFSRNMNETVQMLQKFKKLGIEFQPIEGNVDLSIPENLLLQVINMVLPQIENERRGLNTKRGMRQARREGRWNGTIPRGYKWDRQNNKSIIVPDENAKFIKESFMEMAKGIYTMEEVRRYMWEKGYKCSRNQFTEVLRNPVYIGQIRIPSWRDEPDEIAIGLHEPIINQETFNQVQNILNKRSKIGLKHFKIDHNLPLRGFLKCIKCGNNLTGSSSRSHTGQKYSYYHCTRKCSERFRADKANNSFSEYLRHFEISEEVLCLYYEIMKELFNKNNQQREIEKRGFETQINENNKLIENSEEKYFKDLIDQETYVKAKERYTKRIQDLRQKIEELNIQNSDFMRYVDFNFSLLKNLSSYYDSATTSGKRKMIGSIFPEKLIFDHHTYRTPQINEVLEILTSNITKLGEIKKEKAAISRSLSYRASPRGFEPRLQE